MNILHITPAYYPAFRFGGPIQSVHLLNKELIKKGIKVDVLTTNAGLSKVQREKILRQAQDDKDGWNEVDFVKVKYLSFVGYEHYNFSLQIVKEIWKIIDNYDLVHITAVWNFPVLAGALISLMKKKPYIISLRGVLHKVALTAKSSLVKKLYFNLFAKHYLKKAAAIHYTTEVEKEESEKILNHKNGFVISNGIEISSIAQSAESKARIIDKKYILILGRIDRIKGFDILIPAFANIAAKFNDLKLVIAGDDTAPYAQEVRKKIEEQKISDKIIFTRQVIGDDKWNLFKNAFMFVLPSYSENFGMSVVEAMVCGCPIIVSDKVGIYKEVEDNNAGIIVETTIKSVEEGIIKLLSNEKLRQQIATNGKAMVKKSYDIDLISVQMISKYYSTIELFSDSKK